MAKLNPQGTALLYATFLGGKGSDNKYDFYGNIAVDSGGNAYVVGTTNSADFPITPHAVQHFLRDSTDAFVAKINPRGTALVYSCAGRLTHPHPFVLGAVR